MPDYRKEFEEETSSDIKDAKSPKYCYVNKDAYVRWLEDKVEHLRDIVSNRQTKSRIAPAPGMGANKGQTGNGSWRE